MTRKAYVNNAPDMRNAQMNDALVKALDPQLARIALKKIANHKSTALEPQLPFALLVEKIQQEDITRTHIDRHKLNTNSTITPTINKLSCDTDNLTVEDVQIMEQYIAHGINVVRHNFKRKALFLKFCKKCSRSGHSISTCPDKRYTKPLDKPNFQKQTFNQSMKGNQNLPNRQVTSNNMTGKPLPFPYRSRKNSRDRNNSRHRSPHKHPQNNSKPYYGNNNIKPPSRNGSPYPKTNFHKDTNNSRPQSTYNNRDGNCPQQPISQNRLRNVRNYINTLLYQEQTDDTTSHTEINETQNVSDETLLAQQFNDSLLELNQDTKDEYFNCQEECNTLTEEYILSTLSKSNICVLPLTMYTRQTPDPKRTISPPLLEIDFLLDSGAFKYFK